MIAMRLTKVCLASVLLLPGYVKAQEVDPTSSAGVPANAKFACPMEKHPDEADPSRQGSYFSSQRGKCPWCGMELKPLEQLAWVRLRQAARGGDVAYTCPDHQHVFSESAGECPRCGRPLMPFKVMYTCPDPKHAGIIRTVGGNCPRCGRGLAAFRGVWLDESMADANAPPSSGLAEAAAFRCSIHPLVHSGNPGQCTICAQPLKGSELHATSKQKPIPSGASFVCPMEECWQFSQTPGECSVCGMRLEPIEQVDWAKTVRDHQSSEEGSQYVCPMHPREVRTNKSGTCSICGMQLVHAATFSWPKEAPEHVAAQIDYLTEHYLELQSLLAADRTNDVARQALAIVAAGDELAKHLERPGIAEAARLRSSVEQLREAALKIRGKSLEQDRVALVDLGTAMTAIIEVARPSRDRWPKLYIYHCPMSKGDWIQSSEAKRNPYYGFKMLTCGELKDLK